MEPLPFRAEYAKSGRSSCKACKSTIAAGELRLARMIQVRNALKNAEQCRLVQKNSSNF